MVRTQRTRTSFVKISGVNVTWFLKLHNRSPLTSRFSLQQRFGIIVPPRSVRPLANAILQASSFGKATGERIFAQTQWRGRTVHSSSRRLLGSVSYGRQVCRGSGQQASSHVQAAENYADQKTLVKRWSTLPSRAKHFQKCPIRGLFKRITLYSGPQRVV